MGAAPVRPEVAVLGRVTAHLDAMPRTRAATVVFVLLMVVYLPTANWTFPYPIDPLGNAIAGWHLGERGTFVWEEFENIRLRDGDRNSWLVDSERGPTSQYPPGMAVLLAPAYAVAGVDELIEVDGESRYRDGERGATRRLLVPNLAPATAVATLASALSFSVLVLTVHGTVRGSTAVVGALLGGLGTSAWSVAAAAPFQHGPIMLFVALAGAAGIRGRWWLAGVWFGAGVLIRPPVVILAAVVGLVSLRKSGSLIDSMKLAVAPAVALAVVASYNLWMFGSWSISGGYGPSFRQNVISTDIIAYSSNVLGGLFDPFRGLLVASPFLILLLPGLRRVLSDHSIWVVGGLAGAVVYLAFTWKANRFSGGDGHWSYRYPLDCLLAAAPALMMSYERWTANAPLRMVLFRMASVAAITLQTVGAVVT